MHGTLWPHMQISFAWLVHLHDRCTCIHCSNKSGSNPSYMCICADLEIMVWSCVATMLPQCWIWCLLFSVLEPLHSHTMMGNTCGLVLTSPTMQYGVHSIHLRPCMHTMGCSFLYTWESVRNYIWVGHPLGLSSCTYRMWRMPPISDGA